MSETAAAETPKTETQAAAPKAPEGGSKAPAKKTNNNNNNKNKNKKAPRKHEPPVVTEEPKKEKLPPPPRLSAAQIAANRAKMAAGKMGGQLGGKGSIRRKKKIVHESAAQEEKKLERSLQLLNIRDIGEIQEVNFFMKSNEVIHFSHPSVGYNAQANAFSIRPSNRGQTPKTAPVEQFLPGILDQLPREMLTKDLLEKLTSLFRSTATGGAGGSADDDVPDLVDDFEAAAADSKATEETKAESGAAGDKAESGGATEEKKVEA